MNRIFKISAAAAVLVYFFFIPPTIAAEGESLLKDAAIYVETIKELYNQDIITQIKGWEKFLKSHPQNTFNSEIKKNLDLLKQIAEEKGLTKASVEFSHTEASARNAGPQSARRIWSEYLKKSPPEPYRSQAELRIRQLGALSEGKVYLPKQKGKQSVEKEHKKIKRNFLLPEREEEDFELKLFDPEDVRYRAAVNGIIIPGAGYFYIGDYATGAVLCFLRAGGAAAIAGGAIKKSPGFYISGAGTIFTTWLIDVIGSPVKAKALNEKMRSKKVSLATVSISTERHIEVSLKINF